MATRRTGKLRSVAFLRCITALAAALIACSEQDSSSDQGRSPATPVRVVRVTAESLKETVDAVGSLRASEEVTIRPEISAVVRGIHFREGEPVEAGNLLFSLESDEIRQRLEARRAALKAAEAETANSRRMLERRRALLADNTIARETFEGVKTRYEVAVARQKRLRAEIGQLIAELEKTEIRSPIDGVAGAQNVDPGDFVEIGDPLVTVVRTDVLEIDFTVPERYTNRVREGMSVMVRTAAEPGRSFEGTVFFVSPKIRENTRGLLLKARVDNPGGRLHPGGFVNVELVLQVRTRSPTVPEEALVPTRTGYIVFVVKDQRAFRRDVTIGLRRPGIVEIRKGLQAEETVVRSGHIAVSDGERVEIVKD